MAMRLVMEHDRPRGSTFADGYVTAAIDSPPRQEGAPSPKLSGRRVHAVIAVEGVWSGDGRLWEVGAFTWADLPLPLMAQDTSTHGPGDVPPSIQVGQFDTIERRGTEIHGWAALFDSEDPTVVRLQDMILSGQLPGISLDGDDPEYEIIVPAEAMAEPTLDEEGNMHMSGAFPRQVFSHTRIRGATAVPFQAFTEAVIGPDDTEGEDPAASFESPLALAASLLPHADAGVTGWTIGVEQPDAITAAATAELEFPISAPLVPPAGFFDELHLDGPTALTVTAAGEVIGHLALWGQCHIGSPPGECITPPSSITNYAHFLLGEIVVDDGSRVQVGKITMGTGHANVQLRASAEPWWSGAADMALTASAAAAHYDNTGTVVASVTCGEDEWGIWLHGALQPGLDPLTIRTLLASDLSGDWRRVGANLELVAMLAVNVPGFPKPGTVAQRAGRRRNTARCRVRSSNGQIAALVACVPVAHMEAPVLPDHVADMVVERIAATIGRSRQQRIAALRNRVHGG